MQRMEVESGDVHLLRIRRHAEGIEAPQNSCHQGWSDMTRTASRMKLLQALVAPALDHAIM